MAETCRIQWIDEEGRPTPDQNPAVGTVYVQAHRDVSPIYPQGYHDVPESEHFPICAQHLDILRAEQREHDADPQQHRGIEHWVFEPYALVVDWDGPFDWRITCPTCGQPQGHLSPMTGYGPCPHCGRPTYQTAPTP